MVCKKDKMVKI